MVSLKDIAGRLNIGVSTVSEVLNGKSRCYASEKTKTQILELAQELGYLPNRMSRGMKGLPTNTIGIIGTMLKVPIAGLLIDKFNQLIEKNGCISMLGDSHFNPDSEKKLIQEFLSRGVDAILIHSCMTDRELENTIRGRVPYICFNNATPLNVITDRSNGVFMAIEHLITQHNHKKIGYVGVADFTGSLKIDGYKSALAYYHIPYCEDYCFHIKDEFDTLSVVKEIKSLGVTALFCANDFIAGNLVGDLTGNGISVPREVAVIGFDGLEQICNLIRPRLTSVKQPIDEIAHVAVDLLMKLIKGEECEEKVYYINPLLSIRQSCGCQ